ncbi:MAG: peptidylprolyl isomerase [Corynebacterium sp.]|nr:peptidylprolyl isomerase [Corynebacterium sp.]
MSDNSGRRKAAMQSLDKEIKSRDRAEKMKPLGVVTAAAVAILVIVGGIIIATKYTGNTDTENQAANSDAASQAAAASTTATPTAKPLTLKRAKALADTVTCKYDESGEQAAKEVSLPTTDNVSTKGTVKVKLTTNQGDIDMELDRSVSPCTVNAITHLAEAGYYNDTVCHRLVTEGIKVLQCGDPTGKGSGGPGFKFADEYPVDEANGSTDPVNYERGTIAMANSGRGTNGSQFFLNWGDSPLAPSYTYFGKISDSGLQVLDKIAKAGVEQGAGDGKPAQEVKIEKATVES